jgi:hypothetical protein
MLLIDWDCATMGDRRLVAHLAPDEPSSNAKVICEEYLRTAGDQWCRQVRGEDLTLVPPDAVRGAALDCAGPAAGPMGATEWGQTIVPPPLQAGSEAPWVTLASADGERVELALLPGSAYPVELRWCMNCCSGPEGQRRAVSLREVVGRLESYEPARVSARALIAHEHARSVSTATLAGELARVHASRIVLNRALREAVLEAVRKGEASMSEIALRCGRMKRESRGVVSGETTWLARRIGLAVESRSGRRTPWVHTEVLAMIARDGLGVSPREVELA